MLRIVSFGLLVTAMLAAASGPAGAQAPAVAPAPPPAIEGPVYCVIYFEVDAPAAAKTTRLLRQFAAAARQEKGNGGFLALRESGRTGRFAMIEMWRDKEAADAHGAAVSGLADKLKPVFAAPFDIRVNSGLAVAGPTIGAEPDPGNIAAYVLTHVDVFPAGKDQTVEMLKALAEASRKEEGNLRFDILQQAGRLNHLPIFEAWRTPNARDTHLMAAHTRAFRAKLVALQGALYDERVYRAIR